MPRAVLAALSRPAWALTAPAVLDALGPEATAAVTAWAAARRAVPALTGHGTYNAQGKTLRALRAMEGYEGLPRVTDWTPTPAQASLALRYLESRVAHATIVEKISEIGPRPSLRAFSLWATEARGLPPQRGRPRGPAAETRAKRALAAAEPGEPLRVTAERAGLTVQALRYAMKNAALSAPTPAAPGPNSENTPEAL